MSDGSVMNPDHTHMRRAARAHEGVHLVDAADQVRPPAPESRPLRRGREGRNANAPALEEPTGILARTTQVRRLNKAKRAKELEPA